MGQSKELRPATEVLQFCNNYGKNSVEIIRDYVLSEGNYLSECSYLESDRLSTYLGTLIALQGVVFFMREHQEKRIVSKEHAYDVQGLSLEDEKKRLDDLNEQVRKYEQMVELWNPTDPLECKRLIATARQNNLFMAKLAERISSQDRFKNTITTKTPEHQQPLVEAAPGPVGPSEMDRAPAVESNENETPAAEDDGPAFQECEFNFFATVDSTPPAINTGKPQNSTGKAKNSATSSLSFHPRREEYYTKEEWQNRLLKVGRCSSIGELLRLFIGTEMLPTHTPMEPSELDAFVKEQLLLTSPKAPPLWSCSFTLPMTPGNKYIFSQEACDDTKKRYVTQTKSYTRKLKSKQIAFFRAAMTLYPDETAYYCTLQRSDLNIAEEAKESPFDFTDSSRPFTEQLTSAFAEQATVEVSWSLEQTFPSVGAVLPDGYEVKAKCGSDTYKCRNSESVVSAFVGAMMDAETQKASGNNTVAMWTEFALLKPPVMNVGREATTYLFDRFFGVKYGKESALDVEFTMEGNMWRAIVKLRYSLASSDTVTVATATALSKREAEDLALRYSAARNFPEVFEQITKTDPTKVNAVLMKYSQEILEMVES